MKVLITGATGLIGTSLSDLLLNHGIGISYLTTRKDEIRNEPGIEGFYWNPQQGQIDKSCLINVDVIIHLAGASISKRWTEKYKQEILESRIISAGLLFKILRNNPHQVKQFISASAIGIYPDSPSNTYVESDAEKDNSFLGHIVAKWEEAADKFQTLGLKVCKIRTGLVLSDRGGMLHEIEKPVKLGLGAAFGSGKQWQSWIHIDDLSKIFFEAAQKQWEGVYNAVAPDPVSNKSMISLIAKRLHKPYFLPNIPKFLMKLILGEMHILLYTSQNVSSRKLIEKGFIFKYSKIDEALKNLVK